jgi:hypothetical protein
VTVATRPIFSVVAVGDEHEIKLGRFCQFRLLFVKAEINAGVCQRVRVTPFAPAVADTVDHGA